MPKIVIIDYGVGNLRSISKALEETGATPVISKLGQEIHAADALILPGVGAFEEAVKHLKPISQLILEEIDSGKPLLGICLGLQLLFTASTEGGLRKGLNVFNGKVVRLPKDLKIPHIGWNTLKVLRPENPILNSVPDGSYVYFVHSYYAQVECRDHVIAETEYGIRFPSIIAKGRIFATQFHPEKSAAVGLRMIGNFVNYVKA